MVLGNGKKLRKTFSKVRRVVIGIDEKGNPTDPISRAGFKTGKWLKKREDRIAKEKKIFKKQYDRTYKIQRKKELKKRAKEKAIKQASKNGYSLSGMQKGIQTGLKKMSESQTKGTKTIYITEKKDGKTIKTVIRPQTRQNGRPRSNGDSWNPIIGTLPKSQSISKPKKSIDDFMKDLYS